MITPMIASLYDMPLPALSLSFSDSAVATVINQAGVVARLTAMNTALVTRDTLAIFVKVCWSACGQASGCDASRKHGTWASVWVRDLRPPFQVS